MPSAKAMDNAERAPATGWIVLDAEPAIVAKWKPINVWLHLDGNNRGRYFACNVLAS